jgi:hypothetical protein
VVGLGVAHQALAHTRPGGTSGIRFHKPPRTPPQTQKSVASMPVPTSETPADFWHVKFQQDNKKLLVCFHWLATLKL